MADRRATAPPLGTTTAPRTERACASPNDVERAALYVSAAELLDDAHHRPRPRRSRT